MHAFIGPQDSSSEEEENEEPSDLEERLERRREKRLWLEARTKLLFDYTQFTYTSGCVSEDYAKLFLCSPDVLPIDVFRINLLSHPNLAI